MRLNKDITTAELMALDYRYHYSDHELLADWQRLCTTTRFKNGSQFRPGIKLCQHFFPNFWQIQNSRGQSFAQAWQDAEVMDQVREWGLRGMSQLWLSWIRRAVFLTAGLCNSSFYRPHLARQICRGTGRDQGVLFDPCAGWGGRLLGTVSAGWRYVACEPNPETFGNLQRMVEFLGIQDRVQLHAVPAEQFDISSLGQVHAVLTSPPYFNLEIYAQDIGQSYNQWSSWPSWRDQWLQPLIDRCQRQLTQGGVSCWNVMNVGRFDLVGAVEHMHRDPDQWQLTASLGMKSPLANLRARKNQDVTRCWQRLT
jgi:hypothetical protein